MRNFLNSVKKPLNIAKDNLNTVRDNLNTVNNNFVNTDKYFNFFNKFSDAEISLCLNFFKIKLIPFNLDFKSIYNLF